MGTLHKLSKTQQTEYGIAHVGNNVIEDRAFININSVDPCYRLISEFVKTHEQHVEFYDSFDYSTAPFAPPNNEFVKIAQARAGGLDQDKKEDFTKRFDAGEALDYGAVLVEIGAYLFIAVGNHRGYGKKDSTNPTDKAIIIRQGDNSEGVMKNILFKIASMGNTQTKQDKDTDSMADISQQARQAWRQILEVDPVGTSSVTAYERNIRADYDSCAEDEKETFRQEWYHDWMAEYKPLSFRTKRTEIYNGAFSEQHGQPIKEYSAGDLKHCFETYNPDYTWDPKKWSMKAPHNQEIHQLAVQWLTFERNMFRQLAEPIHKGESKVKNAKVHLIIEASGGLRKIDSRNTEIEKILKKITEWNTNAKTKEWDLPIVDKIVLPKALRDCGDSDHAYQWNPQTKQFNKISEEK